MSSRIYSEIPTELYERYKIYLEMTDQKMKDHIMIKVMHDLTTWERENPELVEYHKQLRQIKEKYKK